MLRVKNDGCEVALAATPTRRKPAEAHTRPVTELRAKAYPKVRRLQASQSHLLTAWASLQKNLPYQGQRLLEHAAAVSREGQVNTASPTFPFLSNPSGELNQAFLSLRNSALCLETGAARRRMEKSYGHGRPELPEERSIFTEGDW